MRNFFNIFNSVPVKKPKRSLFDLSFENKLSMDFGTLVPTFCKMVVPGDKFKVSSEIMMRTMPLVAPVMHRVNITTHWFYVPLRLIWNDFEDWQRLSSQQVDKEGHPDPSIPVYPDMRYAQPGENSALNIDKVKTGSLADYLGFPSDVQFSSNRPLSQLPFRAYQLIYNEWYRDENLIDEVPVPKSSGKLSYSGMTGSSFTQILQLTTLRRRAWEKDYFTAALPTPQSGYDVRVPLGDQAPIGFDNTKGPSLVQGYDSTTEKYNKNEDSRLAVHPDGNNPSYLDGEIGSSEGLVLDNSKSLFANLADATAATINSIRRAFALQRWAENTARGGKRYREFLMSHYGVRSSDGRFQIPEFLGGGVQPLNIGEVVQTGATEGTSPQGNQVGRAFSLSGVSGFKRYFEEHGILMCIMSVTPRTAYFQGIPKNWLKRDAIDFYFPEFSELGEQEIQKQEIYAASSDPTGTFGYAPRYSEYKYYPSEVHGDFRGSLKFWHMAREFANEPQLNGTFVTVPSDVADRNFPVGAAYSTYQRLYCEIYHNIKAVRPMPKYGLPKM